MCPCVTQYEQYLLWNGSWKAPLRGVNGYIPLSYHVCLFRRTLNGLALRKHYSDRWLRWWHTTYDLGGDLYFSIQKFRFSILNGIPRVMIQSPTTFQSACTRVQQLGSRLKIYIEKTVFLIIIFKPFKTDIHHHICFCWRHQPKLFFN